MMEKGSSFAKKPLDLFVKWSEGQLGLLSQRQRVYGETTKAALGIVRDSLEMRAPEESLKKFCGGMLELCNVPLNGIAGNGTWEEYSREFQKILSGVPVAVNGNGFSEEAKAYGKATWENGSKVSSAFVNWMKSLVREQKFISDTEEAGRIACRCLDATDAFIGAAFDCLLDQAKANSAFVKSGLLKEKRQADPVQS